MKKLLLLVATVFSCSLVAKAATVSVVAGENALATAVAAAASGDVLELGDGAFTEWNAITLEKQLTIKAAEGAKPVIKIYSFKFSAGSEGSVIDGLEVENLSNDNYLFRTGGNVAGSLTFKNCVMHNKKAETTNPTPYFYLSSNTVETLTIDNCIFTDNDKTEGAIVYGGSATVTNFNMTNSTAYNMPNDLAVRLENLTNAYVDHCTFYNCGTRVLYLKGMTTSLVQNCIVANPAATSNYCIAAYSGDVKNVMYYNTTAPRSGSTNTDCVEADPKFKDAANADFTLMEGSPALTAGTDGKAIGDPRWVAAAPEVTADRRIFAYDLRMTEASGVCTFTFKTNTVPTEANIVLYRGGAIIDRKPVTVSETTSYSVAINKTEIAGTEGEKMAWGVEVKAGKVKAIAEIFNEGVSARQRMFLNMDLSTESPYFGRIYSNNRKVAGDVSGAVYGQDYSVINAAAVSLGNAARPGVDAEGTVYWSDYGDGTAGVRVMNPETFVSAQLFQGTKDGNGLYTSTTGEPMCGSTMCAEISGEGADTKLWVCNEDAATGLQAQGLAMFQLGQTDGTIVDKWDAAPTWAPTISHNAGSCFAMRKTNRGIWWAQNRGKGQNLNANRSLMFIDNEGAIKWVSDNETIINGSSGGGMNVNADESKVYLVNGDGNILVFDVTWNETDVVPALTQVDSIVTPYSHVTSIVLDPAGNMVTAAGTYGTKMSLVVYSMPTDNNEIIIPAAKSQAINFAGPSTDLEEMTKQVEVRKVLMNGQLYIIRDNVMYNMQGQIVR